MAVVVVVVVAAVAMVVELADADVRAWKRVRGRENAREANGGRRRRVGQERNENGCGGSLACKMLRRRYHTARD